MKEKNIALMKACIQNDKAAAVKLISNGFVDLNTTVEVQINNKTQNPSHSTPLIWAHRNKNIELMRELLDKGANITQRCVDGNWIINNVTIYNANVLDLALLEGWDEQVKFLLVYAACYLSNKEQKKLLEKESKSLPQDVVVLDYVRRKFPLFQKEFAERIKAEVALNKSGVLSLEQIMENFKQHTEDKTDFDSYIDLFSTSTKEVLADTRKQLQKLKFDDFLRKIDKCAVQDEHEGAKKVFADSMRRAETSYLLNGDRIEFISAIAVAVTDAKPILRDEGILNQLIAGMLELLAKIVPINPDTINFFKKTDLGLEIEKLQKTLEDLNPAPSAPPADLSTSGRYADPVVVDDDEHIKKPEPPPYN